VFNVIALDLSSKGSGARLHVDLVRPARHDKAESDENDYSGDYPF
jgi:hypothetical protein